MGLSQQQIIDFQLVVKDYYAHAGRHDLAWRQPEPSGVFDPYKILVSELMLQQTQVTRVTPKFTEFLELFPTVEALANTSLAAVLTVWSGLGYNRRAKFLHQAAKTIVEEFKGKFPNNVEQLTSLPGVGRNTAGAIAAYAFNQPVVFVETNIRTVYFYHFFDGREVVSDGEVLQILAQTLPWAEGKRAARDDGFIPSPGAMRKTVGLSHMGPREWYWSLMDYGAYLKSSGTKLNTLSKHYTKQSKFAGSKRQIRGKVIKQLALQDQSLAELQANIVDSRLSTVLADLLDEGLIIQKNNRYHLSD